MKQTKQSLRRNLLLLSHTHHARSTELVQAPKHWMLDKLRGRWAPKPSAGPHKLREILSWVIFGASSGNGST